MTSTNTRDNVREHETRICPTCTYREFSCHIVCLRGVVLILKFKNKPRTLKTRISEVNNVDGVSMKGFLDVLSDWTF